MKIRKEGRININDIDKTFFFKCFKNKFLSLTEYEDLYKKIEELNEKKSRLIKNIENLENKIESIEKKIKEIDKTTNELFNNILKKLDSKK